MMNYQSAHICVGLMERTIKLKFFTLGCTCGSPAFGRDVDGQEAVLVFRSRIDAEVAASELKDEHNRSPRVIEVELLRV